MKLEKKGKGSEERKRGRRRRFVFAGEDTSYYYYVGSEGGEKASLTVQEGVGAQRKGRKGVFSLAANVLRS